MAFEPTSIAEYVFPNAAIEEKIQDIVHRKSFQSVLLYGPYGTGKSSLAKLLPAALVPEITDFDVLRLRGENRNNNAGVIARITQFASTCPLNAAGNRFVVVDEADNYPASIQHDLKGVLDDCANVMFIMTTNNFNQVDGGLRSRCERIHIDLLDPRRWVPRLTQIHQQRGLPPKPAAEWEKLATRYRADTRELIRAVERITA